MEIKVDYLREYTEPIYDIPEPPAGKIWKNKKNGYMYTSGINLGKLFILNGKMLDEPYQETVDDYELIDKIEDDVQTV